MGLFSSFLGYFSQPVLSCKVKDRQTGMISEETVSSSPLAALFLIFSFSHTQINMVHIMCLVLSDHPRLALLLLAPV